ncbi:hypothetical protein [Pseudoalteromonas sp. T1lg24]|uniref:hypothetical protein n=1 Tax=Pseudoalteromonas sp. T1lg24 TaxID=2077099 RepID=UPI000CF61BFE|nr:hypothetical protein [Pseudoalteromonas sp. T1lg24]
MSDNIAKAEQLLSELEACSSDNVEALTLLVKQFDLLVREINLSEDNSAAFAEIASRFSAILRELEKQQKQVRSDVLALDKKKKVINLYKS